MCLIFGVECLDYKLPPGTQRKKASPGGAASLNDEESGRRFEAWSRKRDSASARGYEAVR